MTEDAKQLLEHLHSLQNPEGVWVVVGDLEKAMGWDLARTQKAMDETVANKFAAGTTEKNTLCVPSMRR
jgi:hypothetical protein